MYARKTPFVVLVVLLFSSFSGMVSGSSLEGSGELQGQSDENTPEEPNWKIFEDPVAYTHQIK